MQRNRERYTKMLSKEERAWLKRFQEIASQAPARFSAFTTGENYITIYESKFESAINELLDAGDVRDFCEAVDKFGAEVEKIHFPFCVHSTAG